MNSLIGLNSYSVYISVRLLDIQSTMFVITIWKNASLIMHVTENGVC